MSRARNLICACLIAGALTAAGRLARAGEDAPALPAMEAAWSIAGTWTGVAVDPDTGSAYAIDTKGTCARVDAAGTVLGSFRVPGAVGAHLRYARLPASENKALLVIEPWRRGLQARGLDGKRLWDYPAGPGIDDAWAADLDGDGVDEVIVGYNGSGGVHVLSGAGKRLWRARGIGNVWHVCAGDVLQTGKPQVVTTSAAGQVHVFAADGSRRMDLDPEGYANMVRIAPPSDKRPIPVIIVAGPSRGDDAVGLTALTGHGEALWQLSLPAGEVPYVASADCAATRPLVAVALYDGPVYVVDIDQEKIIGSVPGRSMIPQQVTWMPAAQDEPPLLLVATGEALNAFRVPEEAPAE